MMELINRNSDYYCSMGQKCHLFPWFLWKKSFISIYFVYVAERVSQVFNRSKQFLEYRN